MRKAAPSAWAGRARLGENLKFIVAFSCFGPTRLSRPVEPEYVARRDETRTHAGSAWRCRYVSCSGGEQPPGTRSRPRLACSEGSAFRVDGSYLASRLELYKRL